MWKKAVPWPKKERSEQELALKKVSSTLKEGGIQGVIMCRQKEPPW